VNMEDFQMFESGLSGTIPQEYSQWSKTVNFFVDANNLVGPFPDVSSWASVANVLAQNNFLTGSYPEGL
jgi:hypothetical protein